MRTVIILFFALKVVDRSQVVDVFSGLFAREGVLIHVG